MKHWIARYKISEALRQHRPLSLFWRNRLAASPELRQFERASRELDRQLRDEAARPAASSPKDLHADIMQAVREDASTARPAPAPRTAALLSILTPPRLASLLVAVAFIALLWWTTKPPGPSRSQFSPPEASSPTRVDPASIPTPESLLADLPPFGPGRMDDPLTQQLEALSDDARTTARFLVASLP